jgi:hypothetical protein
MIRVASFFCLILSISAQAFAATVPNRYIVQLSGEPAATHAASRGHRAFSADPEYRAQLAVLQRQHRLIRVALEANGAQVLGETTAVMNAFIVRIPDAQAAALRSVPGVLRVHAVRLFQHTLDSALPLVKAPDAWNQIGGQGVAGLGVKIAMIDTGMDSHHAALNDDTLTPPDGFPIVSRSSDVAYTNNKIIVARSYAVNSDGTPAPALDSDGHGTGTSTVAAGAAIAGPLGPISGVAPKAFLGNYKVFPDDSSGAQEDWIMNAIDDAVADGMDIINLSLGTSLASRPGDDLLAQVVENATAAGKIVTISAGNSGSDPNTIGSPGIAPDAITVGSTWNARDFAASLQPSSGAALAAYPGSGTNSASPVSAALIDVAAFDPTGLACDSLPADSLKGSIALISRGVCFFETKINNAQLAGAVAAVIYTDAARPDPFTMNVGGASLPAALLSYQDGASLKQQLSGGTIQATLDFTIKPIPVSPNRLSEFSSRGPNSDFGIKPDMVAVGEPILTASLDSAFVVESGTSFSAPMVAGAAALLKAARPGLTFSQYRSLLIDSATPVVQDSGAPLTIQQAGAGFLNVLNAINSNVTASPASLNFGAGSGAVDQTITLTVTNAGASSDTFSLIAQPLGSGVTPSLSGNSVQLNPGESQQIAVQLNASALDPGAYQGYIQIQGTQNATAAVVPYWYGVPSQRAVRITVLDAPNNGRPGSSQTILIRPTDGEGLPVSTAPDVSLTSGGGTVTSIESIDADIPGAYMIRVRVAIGANVLHIASGSASADITIQSP